MSKKKFIREIPALIEGGWVDTGIDIVRGTYLNIDADPTKRVIYANDDPSPDKTGPAGFPKDYKDGLLPTFLVPGKRFCRLVGRVGQVRIDVGLRARYLVKTSGRLYLAVNDIVGMFKDNAGSFSATIYFGKDKTEHDGAYKECPCVNAVSQGTTNNIRSNRGAAGKGKPNPISLYQGVKTEQVTDLSVRTAQGNLEFIRTYQQDSQQLFQNVLGLGWWHNHAVTLKFNFDEDPNKMVVWLDHGTRAVFKREETTTTFIGQAGSSSRIEPASGEYSYQLIMPDDSRYYFNGDYKIAKRTWSNGEEWNYIYGTDQVTQVEDGYGRSLKFAYSPNQLLWRVGDHTTVNLEATQPTGRYIEFSYEDSRLNGQLTNPVLPLLTTVRDVSGQIWTYQWYGQQVGENDANIANWLTRLTSPNVDSTLSGIASEPIVIKDLSYTYAQSRIQQIQQRLGKLGNQAFLDIKDYEFRPNDEFITLEKQANITEIHYFDDEVYIGSEYEGFESNLTLENDAYRPAEQIDANGNTTLMDWSSNGQLLNSVTDAQNATTQFSYDPLARLIQSINPKGLKTYYFYDSSYRQPNLIISTTGNVTSKLGRIDDENLVGWESVNRVEYVTIGNLLDSKPYVLFQQATSVTDVIESQPITFEAGKRYFIRARVLANVPVTLRLNPNGPSVTNADIYWKTMCLVFEPTLTEAKSIQFSLPSLGSGESQDFFVDGVWCLELDPTAEHTCQNFAYDDKGRVVDDSQIDLKTGVILRRKTSFYKSSGPGAGLLGVVYQKDLGGTNDTSTSYTYDDLGRVIKTQQSSNFGSCDISYTVYDAVGNTLASICKYQNLGSAPQTAQEALALFDPATPEINRVTAYEYDTLNRRVKTISQYAENGVTRQRVNVTLYDALSRVVRTITNYTPQGTSAPGEWVYREVLGEWGWRRSATDVTLISHGTFNNENMLADTRFNARGLQRLTQDVLGNVTLFGYDAADRLIKTIQNAATPQYNNDYMTPNNLDGDVDLSDYPVSADRPDQDVVSSQVYDANGNIVMTTDVRGMRHFTVFDSLNRPIRTVRNAKDEATIDLNPDPDYGPILPYLAKNDPRSPLYLASLDPDRDQIAETTYDVLGRVIRTRQLLENRREPMEWDVTLMGYNALGQQVTTIQHAAYPDYDYASDPTLNAYVGSGSDDQDHVTRTEYDGMGRVLYQIDVNGNRIYSIYDGLGRQIRNIRNYVEQSNSHPQDWVFEEGIWKESSGGAPIQHGARFDQNILNETIYDDDGRVALSRTVEGLESHPAYDGLGRQTHTVQNFANDPIAYEPIRQWVFEDGGLERSTGWADCSAWHGL
jgi:YD repeat-containing protein